MKMDHALRLAADQAAQPDDILSMAERLSGQALRPCGGVTLAEPPRRTAAGPDNLATLRTCQTVLSRTVALLE